MAYVVKRDVISLGLKAGDTLKHEKGKLPDALKFDAYWKEPEEPEEQSAPDEPKDSPDEPKDDTEKGKEPETQKAPEKPKKAPAK